MLIIMFSSLFCSDHNTSYQHRSKEYGLPTASSINAQAKGASAAAASSASPASSTHHYVMDERKRKGKGDDLFATEV